MNFININVNGKEYTLVDEFDDCGKNKIYCFAGDEDDIFCYKIDEKYIQIEDEKLINKVKEKHNMILPDIMYEKNSIFKQTLEIFKNKEKKEEITGKTKQDFIQEIAEILKENIPDLNIEKVIERLNEVQIYTTNELPREDGTIAYYRTDEDAMYFSSEDISSQDLRSKRTRLHESLHSLHNLKDRDLFSILKANGEPENKTQKKRNIFFEEGATEELVESIYAPKNDDLMVIGEDGFCALSSECAYGPFVTLIRQIKFITGKDTIDFLFSGNTDILEKDLTEKCGVDALRTIRYEANCLISDNKERKKLKNENEVIAYLQTILLSAFDKEFEEVNSVQKAGEFLDRLKEFNKLRISIKGEKSFAIYYTTKLKEIEQMMKDQGISKKEIEEFQEQYKYRCWTSGIYENKTLKRKVVQKKFVEYLCLHNIEPKNAKMFHKVQDGVEYYAIVTEKGTRGLISSFELHYYEYPETSESTLQVKDKDFEQIYFDEEMQKRYDRYHSAMIDRGRKEKNIFWKFPILKKFLNIIKGKREQKKLPPVGLNITNNNRRDFTNEITGNGKFRKMPKIAGKQSESIKQKNAEAIRQQDNEEVEK